MGGVRRARPGGGHRLCNGPRRQLRLQRRPGAATPLFGQPPAAEFPLYPNTITTFALPIGFDGLWGQIAHDTDVFTVDVPADDPRTGGPYPGGTTFALNVYVTNQPDLVSGAGGQTPWTTLQLQWTLAPCPGGVFADETLPPRRLRP